MPLVLVATVGAANANAYLDVAAAQAILDGVPNTSAWDSADPTAQAKALVYATTLLEALGYQGVKATSDQALQWPRGAVLDPDYGSSDAAHAGYMTGDSWGAYLALDAIPKRIQRACTQLALAILRAGTKDVWGIDPTRDVSRKTVGPLTTEWVTPSQRRFGLRAIPAVWREVYPLTLAAESSTVERA